MTVVSTKGDCSLVFFLWFKSINELETLTKLETMAMQNAKVLHILRGHSMLLPGVSLEKLVKAFYNVFQWLVKNSCQLPWHTQAVIVVFECAVYDLLWLRQEYCTR